jgi:hypothetical protein
MSENEQAVVELKEQSSVVLAWAQDLAVRTKDDADRAMTRLSELKGIRAKWVAYWKPLKEAAKAAHSAICGKENEGTAIIDQAETAVKGKVLAWQQAERAKAEEAQRKAQAEADEAARRERERLEKEAARLKTPEKKQERLEQAAAVAAPVVTVAAPVVTAAGTSTRSTFKAECVDLPALIAAAVPGSVAASFLVFDQKAADAFARATKGKTPVAGVRFREVESLSVRI